MKVFICSDLHVDYLTPEEYRDFTFPKADVYLIAGDHMNGVIEEHYQWFIEKTQGVPTYFSLGNHDFYGSSRDESIAKAKHLLANTNIHVVQDDHIEIAPGLQLWAADFWTDMNLTDNIPKVMGLSLTEWDDFKHIDKKENGQRVELLPKETLDWHQQSLQKFCDFANSTEDDIIFMSHHGVFIESLVRDFDEKPLTDIDGLRTSDLYPCFSQLKKPPFLVINGHIHIHNHHKMPNGTVLYCNPRGAHGVLKQEVLELNVTKTENGQRTYSIQD
ncbi:hypothetical protein CBF23_012895 [Marinomonas agarivorans]|nr:hypothetical protein CBF23_012895 [Marinomonas agarivorans]